MILRHTTSRWSHRSLRRVVLPWPLRFVAQAGSIPCQCPGAVALARQTLPVAQSQSRVRLPSPRSGPGLFLSCRPALRRGSRALRAGSPALLPGSRAFLRGLPALCRGSLALLPGSRALCREAGKEHFPGKGSFPGACNPRWRCARADFGMRSASWGGGRAPRGRAACRKHGATVFVVTRDTMLCEQRLRVAIGRAQNRDRQ